MILHLSTLLEGHPEFLICAMFVAVLLMSRSGE